MALPPELEARIRAHKGKLEDTPQAGASETPAASEADEVVQLAVRMPAVLRDGIHLAARGRGCSTQEWVNRVLRAAVVESEDPQLLLAGRLFEEIRQELARVVESGDYERFTEALEDPDLGDR